MALLYFKKSPPNTTTFRAFQKQTRCKIKGQETGNYNRMANVEMSAVGGRIVQFIKYQQTDRWPGERLKEHKQWCDYRRIFFHARISFFALCPANPPALKPRTDAL